MNTNASPAFPQTPPENKAQNVSVSTGDVILAWLSLFTGYLFCRVVPVSKNPLGGFLFLAILFVGTAILLAAKGKKLRGLPFCAFTSALLCIFSLILCANAGIQALSFLFCLVAYAYFVYGTAGCTLEPGFSELLPMDLLKSTVCMPFLSFGAVFSAIGNKKSGHVGAVIGKILIGLSIAFIPTGIVLLLLSYDSAFCDLLEKIFDFNWETIGSHIVSILIGVPIGIYLYGLYRSSIDNRASEVLTAERCHAAAGKARIFSALTACAAVTPILFLYVIFFISQWDYYVAAFFHRLPTAGDALSLYSDYAREGFFELCTVSALNLLVLSVCGLFAKREKTVQRVVLKIINSAYALSTLILIATALAKMKLYIDRLGLTPLRVYASWFMLVLAVLFLLILIRQIVPRLPLLALSVCLCALLYCLPVLNNVDARIADYNVNRYLAGTLESIDFEAMEELGDSAVPALVRLARTLDEKNGTDISAEKPEKSDDGLPYYIHSSLSTYEQLRYCLWNKAGKQDSGGLFSFTVPRLRARKALASIGFTYRQ